MEGGEPQGVSSEKKSRHIYFMEDNLLHALSKLGYVKFYSDNICCH